MAVVKKTLPSQSSPSKTPKKIATSSASLPNVADLVLPTTKTAPSEVLQDYSILLFGEKKIGKTTLASMFVDNLLLCTEPGAKSLDVFKMDVRTWKEFKKIIRLLRKDKRFRTVTVDTVDLLFKLCDGQVCSDLGIDHVSEADWGRGWSAVRDEFTTVMADLMSLGKGVILISHSTEKEIKPRSGPKYDRIQPTMPNTARDICEAMVDIWAYFHYDGHDRILTIRGDEHITAGHRLQTRFRHDGKELEHISMGTSKEEAFKNFIDAFNNRYTPKVVTPDEPREIKTVKKLKIKVARRG